jgi:NADH:ubiquinone oxidoreductase subunit E
MNKVRLVNSYFSFKEDFMSLSTLDAILQERRSQPHLLIEVLQDVQEAFGYVSEKAMKAISKELGIPLIEVYRVASFYKAFSLTPRGKNLITICLGTACHVRQAKLLLNQALSQLQVEPGGTTEDGLFTVEHVNCLGACALGPVVVFNDTYHHHTKPGKIRGLIQKTRKAGKEETGHA